MRWDAGTIDKALQKDALKAIKACLGNVCRARGFVKFKSSWRRTLGDSVQVIHMDRRTVGEYPYYVEAYVGFFSLNVTYDQNYNTLGAHLHISRMTDSPEQFLAALNIRSGAMDMQQRCDIIHATLNEFISRFLDKIEAVATITDLKSQYPSNNVLWISESIRKTMPSSSADKP